MAHLKNDAVAGLIFGLLMVLLFDRGGDGWLNNARPIGIVIACAAAGAGLGWLGRRTISG